MPLPCPSGQISLADIQNEFGGSNPTSINEYYANGGLVPAGTGTVPTSGQISFSDFFCALNEIVIYITQNSENVNVQSLFGSYWTQSIRKRLVINPGVVVGSRYTSSPALNIPSGAVSTLTVDNYGSIQGAGGYPDIVRTNFFVTRDATYDSSITFNGPNTFTFSNTATGSQDQLVYTNTNYSISGSASHCGYALRIIASNAIGLDDGQGCSPDGDYNDTIVYIGSGYFFQSGSTIYYRVDAPYGNGPTGGSAVLANSAVRINNQGSIYGGGGSGGRGGDGGSGYYSVGYDCPQGFGYTWTYEGIDYYYNTGDYYGSCNVSCSISFGDGAYCGDTQSNGDLCCGGAYYTAGECFCCWRSATCYYNVYTSGGAGGQGGQGQGYAQNLTAGGSGFPGGVNAGGGGTGGSGGSFGNQGVTGNPGGNGNTGGGGAGRAGGSAGCYITNNYNVTWIANGDRRGRVC